LADNDRDERNRFTARLKGFTEVPSVSSTGSGRFSARIRGDTIEWRLSYEGLEGLATLFAHVHVAQPSVNGGVSFFLCGGGTPAQPPCTPGSGSFSGTATAANIQGPVPQGIAAGEIAEVIRAMRAGKTYANVHTDKHGGGEIRGDIRAAEDDDDDDDGGGRR
jgi:hypothetical protein